MKAIILAAGKGERLMPLTSDTPKSLLELENETTLLESQLININKTGITKIVIVTGYLTEKIESKVELFREKYNIDKSYFHFSDPDCFKHLGQNCDCKNNAKDFIIESWRTYGK